MVQAVSFLAAYDFISDEKKFKLDKIEKEFLKFKTFRGWEIVPNAARLVLNEFIPAQYR